MSASLEQHYIPFDGLAHLDWHFMEAGRHSYQAPGWLRSMRSETFSQMKFIIFQGCLAKQVAFLVGSMLSIIIFLFSNFRSRDYPENFGTYFQLDRKRETGFFTFLSVYVS